jgi:hypothetical protein
MFTEQDDVVPQSGAEQIVNLGIANTLGGDDIITGTGGRFRFLNYGTLNTDDGNDMLTGIRNLNEDPDIGGAGFRNAATADLIGNIDTGIVVDNSLLNLYSRVCKKSSTESLKLPSTLELELNTQPNRAIDPKLVSKAPILVSK